ncbi:hypothetical protein WJX84_000378 [Apatococcus fuscideae]|uniref:Uncharacterized protein n=1 Tax=Apatococcus fuscideae TaxID=2026836 RepID=A0AAW1TA10_9CHLO
MTAEELDHPCLHLGFSRPYALKHQDPNLPALIKLVGRPDWAACERLAAAVVDSSLLCPQGDCHVAETIRQQKADFYALTGFYVVFHFLRLPSTAGLDQLLTAGRRYCQEPWEAIPVARRQEIHAETYCFRAPFVADLLKRGLGLQQPQALWGLLLAGCLLWLAWLIWCRICIGMGRPPTPWSSTPLDALHVPRRVGVDKLVDASLLPPASRQRSMQLGPIREDQRVYHTGGTARVGSMPLPSLGPINVDRPQVQLPSIPGSPGHSGFFWSPSTRAIGGSFNSNMHWLNSQRKRNMSQDNLELLYGAELC